jgi:hypothetical protein
MARVIMMLFGLGLLAVGVWLTVYVWPEQTLAVLEGCLAMCALVAGLVVTVFALSEIAGARGAKKQNSGK